MAVSAWQPQLSQAEASPIYCNVLACILIYSRSVVTRIVLETFEQGPIWSGTLYSLATVADQAIHNFVGLNSPTAYDKYASVITSFNYNQASGFPTIANLLQYTKEATIDTPATFAPFFEIPLIYNSTTVANMTKTTQVTASLNPAGVR